MSHNLCKNIAFNTLKKHMFWIFVRIASLTQFYQISKYMFMRIQQQNKTFLTYQYAY